MARVLITGSSDGLGLMAPELLAQVGHAVTLQANALGCYEAVIQNAGIGYFYHQQPRDMHPAARSVELQDRLPDGCAELTGVVLPNR